MGKNLESVLLDLQYGSLGWTYKIDTQIPKSIENSRWAGKKVEIKKCILNVACEGFYALRSLGWIGIDLDLDFFDLWPT